MIQIKPDCPKCHTNMYIEAKGMRHVTGTGIMYAYRCYKCVYWFDVTRPLEDDFETYEPDLWWEDFPTKQQLEEEQNNEEDAEKE